MYYIWESRREPKRDALINKFAPAMRLYGVNFVVGRRFTVDVPELEIDIDRESHGKLTDDLVIQKRRCVLHSNRLINVLQSAGVDNIDYYPCRISDEATGKVYRSHQAVNILDMVFCLDRDNSKLTIDEEEPNEIWYIDNLKLLEDRLGDVLMFRLGERPSIVIVHEKVKEAVEKAGITGVVFLPAEGYRDYQGWAFNNPRNVIGTHDEDPEGPADFIEEEEE
jgi:hypothetical protein